MTPVIFQRAPTTARSALASPTAGDSVPWSLRAVVARNVFSIALAACASEPIPRETPVGLLLLAPQTLLTEVAHVELRVFDAADVRCVDSAITAVGAAPSVLDLHLAHCADNVRWCGSATVEQDAGRTLTWSVEGTLPNGQLAFRGCTGHAVDQNPLQIDIKVVSVVHGEACGDGVILPPKTCDLGGAGSDEACDAIACTTREVLVSNGKSAANFFRGRAGGRKSDLSMGWFDDGKFFATWADAATTSGGNDGSPQITVRRLAPSLVTDVSTSSVLQREVRLQTDAPFTASGLNLRAGKTSAPSLQPTDSTSMLAVFAWARPGEKSRIYTSTQQRNLNSATAPDTPLIAASGSQDQPSTARGANGSIAVVYVEDGEVVAAVRRKDGTTDAVQRVSSATTSVRPRIAPRAGGFVAVWSDGTDVKMRLLGATGAPTSPETIVNSKRTGKHDQCDVAATASGRFLVAFRDSTGVDGADIYVQKFDASGTPLGTEAATPLNNVGRTGDQLAPAVAAGAS
jgi:hypothetical protein